MGGGAAANDRSRSRRRRRREEEKKPNRRRRDRSSDCSSSDSRRRGKDRGGKRTKRDSYREGGGREKERPKERDQRERQPEPHSRAEREKGKDVGQERPPEKEKEAGNDQEKDKDKKPEKEPKRAGRSHSSSSSSSGRSKSPKVARGGNKFDQKEANKEDVALQQALVMSMPQGAKPQAMVPTIPQMMSMPPAAANPQVEEFLMHNPVEAHAAARLRALPFEYQQMVLARGSLMGARDPTAVVLGRIRGLTQGQLQYSRDVMMWSPTMMQQVQSTGGHVPGMTGIVTQPGMPPTSLQNMTAPQQAAPVEQPQPPSPEPVPMEEPKSKRDELKGEQSSARARRDAERDQPAKKSATSASDDKADDAGSKKTSWWSFDFRKRRPTVGEETVAEGAAEAEKAEEGQIEVRLLLMRAGVLEYLPRFIEGGFNSMKAVREMSEADMLEKCGMTEDHVKLLLQDLQRVDGAMADGGQETAAPRTAPNPVEQAARSIEKARQPVPQMPSKVEPPPVPEVSFAPQKPGLAGSASAVAPEPVPPAMPLGQEAAGMPLKLVRPPRPKEPGAPSAQVAHLQAAAARAEAEAAALARRGAELEAIAAGQRPPQDAGGDKPKLPRFVPYKGPPVEPQPQLDVAMDAPGPGDMSFPGGPNPTMNWGPTVSQSPGVRLGKVIPGGLLNKELPPGLGDMGALPEPSLNGPSAGLPMQDGQAGADASAPKAAPKFSVADMLSLSGLKPTGCGGGGGGPKPPEVKADEDGPVAAPAIPGMPNITRWPMPEGPEASGVDGVPPLPPLGLDLPGMPSLPGLDPGMMLDPALPGGMPSMPGGLGMPPMPGLPSLPPLQPGGNPPGPPLDAFGAIDMSSISGMQPGVPGMPQLDPALQEQLQLQQDAATQQAYQFWVQQQLNAQMALFENERSAMSSRQRDEREVKPGPKKPSTQQRLPGDWMCPICGDHQFARNRMCRSCGGPRPADTL